MKWGLKLNSHLFRIAARFPKR